ncbi:hypothetical protein KKF84_14975, partial [Myxococcota bacterium]|nr:hypothetical protein [Myxococcota bacterium]
MKNISSFLSVFILLFALTISGCKDSDNGKVTTDPADSEAPLSDESAIFDGAPTNEELPEDGKFDAVYPATFDLI